MARAATTADVFNAVAERRRRDLLDVLHDGDATVGELVERLDLPQPVVSKHLKVLREVDLVRPRTIGRTRVYTLNDAALAPLHDWLVRYERVVNERLDRLDDYLAELQHDDATTDQPARDQPARDGDPS